MQGYIQPGGFGAGMGVAPPIAQVRHPTLKSTTHGRGGTWGPWARGKG